MRVSAGPKTRISAASSRKPSPAPASAPRQPRTTPTASTIVSASMNSTSEARKAASAGPPEWVSA